MDSSADSQNACSSSSRKRKADEEDSMIVVPSKKARFLQTYRRQLFTLPDSIMHYIAKNPSSAKIYAKLVQSCKYFFVKNPVLLVSQLSYGNGWEATYDGKRTNIDLDKVTSKLWIIDRLRITHKTANLASTILPKIYQCHANILTLIYQHLSYNEVMILASKAELVDFIQVIIKHQDGSIVPFEKIFEAFPCVKSVRFVFPCVTAKTFTELLKIPRFSSLKYCSLPNIPGDFDIESFYVYMKKNKCTRFDLHFSDSISAAYSSRLEEIVDEILDTQIHNYKPPFIRFPGLDFTKVVKLSSLSRQQ